MSGSHPVKFLLPSTRFTLQSGSDYEICLFNINGLRARPHRLKRLSKTPARCDRSTEDKVHDEMFPLES